MSNPEADKEILEEMIDTHTVGWVLDQIQTICTAKADHVFTSYGDRALERRCASIANAVQRCFVGLVTAGILSGCALAPTYVAPELEHMSHITQHGAMGTHNEYVKDGIAIAQVTAHWDVGQAFVEISDGIALNRNSGDYAYGEIYGPREQFTAKIGYKIMVKR